SARRAQRGVDVLDHPCGTVSRALAEDFDRLARRLVRVQSVAQSGGDDDRSPVVRETPVPSVAADILAGFRHVNGSQLDHALESALRWLTPRLRDDDRS